MDSQESSPTSQFKSISSSAASHLYGPFLHQYMTTGKTIGLTTWTFVSKVIFFFLILYVFHRFSSKEQVSFNLMAKITIHSGFRDQENKVCHCFHCFPPFPPHEMMGLDAMILVFWILSFKPVFFSLSSFTFIKRLFISSLLSWAPKSLQMVTAAMKLKDAFSLGEKLWPT